MTSRTAWVTGNGNSGAGLTPLAAFSTTSGADLNVGLATGSSIMSSTIIDNSPTGNLDVFVGFSYVGALGSSSAIAVGATIALWLAVLQGDGSTYGDGLLTAGTAFAGAPAWPPFATIYLYGSTRTTVIGSTFANGPLVLPPVKFRVVAQNNAGFTLGTTTTNQCYIQTANLNLNN